MKIIAASSGSEVISSHGERLLDIDTSMVVEQLSHSGYLLFRGFKPTQEEFESFTNQFGVCAETRHVHYPSTGEGLGFHAEDAYNPYRPDTIWFFCAFKGSDGGIPTGIVDGVKLFQQLPEKWKTFCRTRKLLFSRIWEANVWQDQELLFTKNDIELVLKFIPGVRYRFLSDDSIYITYETPIVAKTIDGSDSFANTILQAITDREFYGMTLSDGTNISQEFTEFIEKLAINNEECLGWETGDVAVIDNLRMMHRRSAYHQIDRDLRVRHGENFFGTQLPEVHTPVGNWVKNLIQGDVALPTHARYLQQ